jgi:hypothetical protein
MADLPSGITWGLQNGVAWGCCLLFSHVNAIRINIKENKALRGFVVLECSAMSIQKIIVFKSGGLGVAGSNPVAPTNRFKGLAGSGRALGASGAGGWDEQDRQDR